jgi:superfamily II DNA/RNA helicase
MFDDYKRLPLCHDIKDSKARTRDVILDDEIKFSSLLLEEQIQRGLAKCGFTLLSPIQKNALPLALTGQCEYYEDCLLL